MENEMLYDLKKELMESNKLIHETEKLRREVDEMLKRQRIRRNDILREIGCIVKEEVDTIRVQENLSRKEYMQLFFDRLRPYFSHSEQRDFELSGKVDELDYET